ncbi:MAG: hypothetical protein N4A54_06975 [Peptostreptococcaceae bacterium]|nr:hypothetical protein [Peptostreptococcaceae bacterium]
MKLKSEDLSKLTKKFFGGKKLFLQKHVILACLILSMIILTSHLASLFY